jgi:vitamin B12 transporter
VCAFTIMKSRVVTARLAVLPLACAAACPVLAQTVPTLPETVVTATRTARTADELMQSVDVLTRQDIELLAPSSLMDLIGSVPGVVVTRSGGPGKSVGVYLRGANSDHVLVLVNGVRASSATLGDYDWNALQPEQIERVEVVRGPLASLYGSDAIGGVIQIFTRGQREGYEVSQTIGSNKMRESSMRLSGGQDTKWSLSASAMGTNGTQMRVTDPLSYPTRSANIGLGLSGKLQDGWSYNLGLTHSEGHDESHVSAGPSDSRNQVIDLSLEGRMSSVWKQKISLYQASNRLVSPAGFPPSDIQTDRRQLSWVNELNMGVGALTLGVDRMLEDVSNLNTQTGAYVFNKGMGTTGVYGQFLTEWAGNDIQLGLRRDQHSVFGGANTYNVSVGRQLAGNWRFYASHGTAFKGPTANDFYWPRSEYNDILDGSGDCLVYGYACLSISEGNPHLLPERSRSNEIGLQVNGPVQYRFNLFETRVSNLIDWDSTESGLGSSSTEVWTPSNVGRASMRGGELSAHFNWSQWRIQASASRILARNEESGAPLDRRPDNTASLSAVRRFGDHTLRVGLTAASERYESSGTRRLAGYGRVDLADTIRLGEHWSLRLKIDNLFDKQYTLATSSGVPYATPGREFYVTLRYTH